jgi:hypothetical protein
MIGPGNMYLFKIPRLSESHGSGPAVKEEPVMAVTLAMCMIFMRNYDVLYGRDD